MMTPRVLLFPAQSGHYVQRLQVDWFGSSVDLSFENSSFVDSSLLDELSCTFDHTISGSVQNVADPGSRTIMIDIDKAKERLANLRGELEAQSSLSAQSRDPVSLDQQSVGRLSRMDALQQQAMSKATEQKRQQDLLRIEAAERRLRDGDYGYCETCGESIPDARLAIDPMAIKCVGCAGK